MEIDFVRAIHSNRLTGYILKEFFHAEYAETKLLILKFCTRCRSK